jgi:hypothetical protein
VRSSSSNSSNTNGGGGTVYVSGRLHRAVRPGDSTWSLGRGEGEEGCVVVLRKANLELLRWWVSSLSTFCVLNKLYDVCGGLT